MSHAFFLSATVDSIRVQHRGPAGPPVDDTCRYFFTKVVTPIHDRCNLWVPAEGLVTPIWVKITK